MKLRKRQKRKQDHALDALASISKTWSEWQLAKRAGKGVAKVKEVRPSKLKAALSSKRAKLVGAVAVTGGVGAFVARKLKGDAADVYTGPAPSDAVDAAASAPEAEPPPLTMAPDPATEPSAGKEPAAPESALRYRSTMPAAAEMPADAPLPEPDFAAATTEPEPEPVAALETSDDDDGAEGAEATDDAESSDEPAAGTAALRDGTATAGDVEDDDK